MVCAAIAAAQEAPERPRVAPTRPTAEVETPPPARPDEAAMENVAAPPEPTAPAPPEPVPPAMETPAAPAEAVPPPAPAGPPVQTVLELQVELHRRGFSC